ncbi:fatty acid desaturase [Providencia hangzhouensis]|uniref:fatty acid desaturase n=1 Tax=Providencia hangzhouensis TaxID=3031799 RepID=UPI0034DD4EA2
MSLNINDWHPTASGSQPWDQLNNNTYHLLIEPNDCIHFCHLFITSVHIGQRRRLFTAPEDKQIKHGWYHHNFVTACDWLPTPHYLWRLTGGLNYHLTHHIFPHWHHRHYPALARILAQLAQQYDMPYRCIDYKQLVSAQITIPKKSASLKSSSSKL